MCVSMCVSSIVKLNISVAESREWGLDRYLDIVIDSYLLHIKHYKYILTTYLT